MGENFNRLVDLDEILYGGDDIEYYLDYILFKPVASTIPKFRTFKLLRWMQNHNSTSCFYGCETWSLTLRDMFHIHPSMDECWINEMYMNVM
jgi:hypothetical protein